jgi:hypothetical protein
MSAPDTNTSSGAGGIVLPAGGLPTPSGSMAELRSRRLELA